MVKYFRFWFSFFVKTAIPLPWKSYPLFSNNPPLKVEVLSSPPFLEIWQEVQPPSRKVGVAHYDTWWLSKNICISSKRTLSIVRRGYVSPPLLGLPPGDNTDKIWMHWFLAEPKTISTSGLGGAVSLPSGSWMIPWCKNGCNAPQQFCFFLSYKTC